GVWRGPGRGQVGTRRGGQGWRAPPLELPPREALIAALGVLREVACLAVLLHRWSALLLALPLGLVARWASRPRAVVFPLGLRTVGELALYLTDFREHRASGYRWTHSEISFKVRVILAECLDRPLRDVRPECTLAELGAE